MVLLKTTSTYSIELLILDDNDNPVDMEPAEFLRRFYHDYAWPFRRVKDQGDSLDPGGEDRPHLRGVLNTPARYGSGIPQFCSELERHGRDKPGHDQ